ncbi:MAG: hypothetical protein IPG89_11215 [Bacteroidetes bacterium]|nr:hypothetical protein [Bacteroidota bacterium]
MENKKDENGGFLGTLLGMAKVAIVFLLIYMYWEAWINSFKEKKWLKFGLLSIIPAMAAYCLIEEMIRRNEPNAHRDMFEAQMAAWERENEKNR